MTSSAELLYIYCIYFRAAKYLQNDPKMHFCVIIFALLEVLLYFVLFLNIFLPQLICVMNCEKYVLRGNIYDYKQIWPEIFVFLTFGAFCLVVAFLYKEGTWVYAI